MPYARRSSPPGSEAGPGPGPAGDPRALPATRADGGRTTLLVRPDGYIARAAERPGTGGPDAVLTAWAGPA